MDGRSILITGCSSGIGLDAARTLKARGWRVLATCRKPADCARLEAEGLESFPLDYEDRASIEAGFAEAMARTGGRLDALFNNGAYVVPGALEDVPPDGMRAIFEANFMGWHALTRLAIPVMRAQGRGRILMNSSVLGFGYLRMRGAYVATKHALEGYSHCLRLELRGTGIEVVLIQPGPIRTRIRENARAHYERWIDREHSAWAGFYREVLEPRLYAENPKPDPFELGPAAVTRKVIHALESTRPRPRYRVTTATYIVDMLRRLLPLRVLDRLFVMG